MLLGGLLPPGRVIHGKLVLGDQFDKDQTKTDSGDESNTEGTVHLPRTPRWSQARGGCLRASV